MHHIQQKILIKLLYADTLSYAQMRPAGVESNHFAYHLDQLVREKLVAKADRKYALAPAGLILVDRLSQEKMVDRIQPHIVTAIAITTDKGETLLFKRAFQPYIYRYGFPNGKTHYEETIHQAAVRELQEKSGLTDIPLTHRGMVYLESKIQGITISKVLYHLFEGRVPKALPTTESHRGSCIWADSASLPDHELMPGFRSMQQLLRKEPGLFFAELVEEQAEKPL